jgi:transposase InsO family protein
MGDNPNRVLYSLCGLTRRFNYGAVHNDAYSLIVAEKTVTFDYVNSNGGLTNLGTVEAALRTRATWRDDHLDIKKLGRINGIGHRITGDRRGQSNLRSRGKGPGWEFVHVAIDDASRIAFAKVMNSERRRSATAFLKAALAYYESLGIKVERVMTDNGSCYKSFAFRRLCKRLGLKHIRTKPYTPKTNGKAERFSRRLCANGLMPRPTSIRIREPMICRFGYTATIGTGPTPASVIKHPSANSALPGTTS